MGGFWLAMNSRLNKRGGLGSFISMFITTIAIVVILTVFVLGSGFVKKLDNADAGISIHDEARTGVSDIFDYMVDYLKIIEARYLIMGGNGLDSALEGVDYEE